jgi:DNA ligase-1
MTIDYTAEQFNEIKVAADWIRDLESSDSRLHKEAVIEKALMAAKLGSANAQCFLFNCYQAYNPYHVFGVKKVPETEGLTGKTNPWPKFWGMLEGLRTRSLTGHNAKTAIEFMSEQFDSVEWNGLARRVIIKDLRCGITERTLNKVLGNTEWAVPTFECQLATDSNKHLGKMTGVKRLEQKLDGVRVLAVMAKNSTVLFSRNGKRFENFTHVEDALDDLRLKLKPLFAKYKNGFVLDGEVIGASFQELMKQAQRKSDVQADDMVFTVFDFIPLEDFYRGYWNAQQHKRTEILEKLRETVDTTTCIRIMDGIDVDLSISEGHDILRRYANDAVNAGFEGIMIKDVDAPYECKRSTFWMKWKPVIEVSLEIKDLEEGTGKNLGRLGALVCEGLDDGQYISVNVGSGLSDDQRDSFWSNRDSLIGQIVEVRADAITQNQDGTYSLRFPRFKGFRGFEAGEKL